MVVFRIIFGAFEVEETRCDAARPESALEMGRRDLSFSGVCVVTDKNWVYIICVLRAGVCSRPLFEDI